MVFYFPTIIVSGMLGGIDEPHWLHTIARYLPAQPLVHAATSALHHAPNAPLLPAHDVLVLAGWVIVGLTLAVLTFRWEPHRPSKRRGGRAAR